MQQSSLLIHKRQINKNDKIHGHQICNIDCNLIEISEQNEKQITNKQQCNILFGAFQDDEDDLIQQKAIKTCKLSQIQIDINRAIAIVSVQFPLLPIQVLISTLYNRLITNTLPKVQNSFSQLSEYKPDQKKQNKTRQERYQKQIDLITIRSHKNRKQYKSSKVIKEKGTQRQFKKTDDFKIEIKEMKFTQNHPNYKFHQRNESKYHIDRDFEIIGVSIDHSQLITVPCAKISQFHTHEQRARFLQKRLVAKAFIRKGYGVMNFRNQLQNTPYTCQFDQSRYKTVSYGIVTDTFRKLEQFLDENCHNYKMQKLEMKPLYSILLNCRDLFPDTAPTFLKFMQAQFNVDCNSVKISRKEAIRLYQRIQVQFRIKEGDTKANQSKIKRRLDEFWREDEWSPDNDSQLLSLYREVRNVAKVRDKYRDEHGPDSEFDDCKVIKSRLNKALRLIIRKLKAIVNEKREFSSFVAFMNNMNNDKIKKILVSPDALNARVALCDFACSKNPTSQIIQKAVILMEDAVKNTDKRKLDSNDYYDDLDF